MFFSNLFTSFLGERFEVLGERFELLIESLSTCQSSLCQSS